MIGYILAFMFGGIVAIAELTILETLVFSIPMIVICFHSNKLYRSYLG